MSFVVGTAGHIDHGKSTLIHALTGIDPDRLEEEKRRGMTIDLGFAHLELPSGREIGIVDVPGHARFIRNMLAGVHGIDAVLLVVAADEGVMPQTREHLEIVDLLDISKGLAVLTKSDLVEPDWLELVSAELSETLAGTSLKEIEIVPVSALTGAGLSELKLKLDSLLDTLPARSDLQRARLPVDRVFTISGFGTVVTGTLVDGSIRLGEELEALPSGRRVRVRGLQQHNVKVEVATPGSRVAANLVGVDKHEIGRGEVLSSPGSLAVTRRVDASVRVVRDAPRGIRHGAHLTLHAGTAEVSARAIVLDSDEIPQGGSGWVQLYLGGPIAARAGDRFVLRLPSPSATLAGGRFADVNPQRHPRHDEEVMESLGRRSAGSPQAVLQEELRKYPRGVTEAALLKATLAEVSDLRGLVAHRAGQWLFTADAWVALRSRAEKQLAAYHRLQPLRPGMPREELRSRLELPSPTFGPVLVALVKEGAATERDGEVALPDHAVEVDPGSGPGARLLEILGRNPFSPPSIPDALMESGATSEVLKALARRGDLVLLSPEIAFTRQAYEDGLLLVREIVGEAGSITVAQLRDRMGASRRPVLALLEYMDAKRITRRLGDARVLRQQ